MSGLLAVLVLLFPLVVLIWLVAHGSRLKRVEEVLAERSSYDSDQKQIAALIRRVYALERQLEARPALDLPAPALDLPISPAPPKPEPRTAAGRPPAPTKEVQVVPAPPPRPEPDVVAAPASPEPEVVPAAGPGWRERLFAGQEWEAVVGGSWLNKLGGVVLVVGLALLLGYSAARVGPLGRVMISLAASLCLLVTGIVVEARGRFRIFARGLIGAGWAGLYSTVYAMHSVEAARVIQNPWLGAALLLAVAIGMIVHSLRYRSEAVTGVAYAAAYVSLAVTPLAAFSVLGLFPITISLLFLSSRMHWHTAALLSLLTTYLVCATRESHGSPLWATTALVADYWLAFEMHDLVRIAQREPAPRRALAIWPLNGAAALLLTYAKWHSTQPQALHWLLAGAGTAFLLSAVARAFLRPPSSFKEDNPAFDRVVSGYEASITASAALIGWASLEGLPLLRAIFALAAEAEALFLAGLAFRTAHLRRLATAVFGAAMVALSVDASRGEPKTANGLLRYPWTPAAVLLAGLFYLNRWLRRGLAYSWAASAVVVVVLGFEVPPQYLGLAWLGFAAVLFEFGIVRRLDEFRFQGYMAGAAAAVSLAVVNVAGAGVSALPNAWRWLYLALAGFYAITGQLLRPWPGRLPQEEGNTARTFCSWAGSLASVAVLWHAVRLENLGLALLVLAAALFELSLLVRLDDLRWQGYTIGVAAAACLAAVNVFGAGLPGPGGQWERLAVAAFVYYGLSLQAARWWPAWLEKPGEQARVRDMAAVAATASTATMLWYALPSPLVALGWGALALTLFEAAPLVPCFRAHSAILAAMTFARLFFGNFTNLGATAFISHRILTVAPVICLFCYLWAQLRKSANRLFGWEASAARLYLYAPVILWTVLLRFELGRTLAVAGWAVTSLLLLAAGFKSGIGDLRAQSYALAALTFIRSWNTNFYIADALLGMPARILTGGFVIANFYAGEFLAPRRKADEPRAATWLARLDAQARVAFSVMATTLFAVLIYYEVSGTLLTVGWGVEGALLLLAGFALRERSLRLAGLTLLLSCAAKLFVYDLRELEIVYRILSFIVLGLLLLGASWIYTRYRGGLKRYL